MPDSAVRVIGVNVRSHSNSFVANLLTAVVLSRMQKVCVEFTEVLAFEPNYTRSQWEP